ncbi:MAG: nucleoside-diphosphate kinase [Gammaproteobacteria bacterium]|nr:nucleoside-diphosphate kinase [Pseudomonadota bacterium]MCH9662332.1 nucleoside-diphosphate kinase [Gammaproteobacteria bacterium]
MQKTFSIIKPDAVKNGHIGDIISLFESSGLSLAAAKLVQLSRNQAEELYRQHAERPFYGELIEFITSGPVVLLILAGDNAIEHNRKIMGATNPAEAAEGTIRNLYAKSIDANAVHGSDSPEAADREIRLFFSANEFVR